MNVLFIGPYKQRDGWGNAAKAHVRSLIASNVNLTIRPVFMSGEKTYDTCEDFADYENNVSKNYDVIIQNVLPNMFRPYKESLNIGLSYFESSNLQFTDWPNKINTLDRMWVSSKLEKNSLLASGVNVPIDIVPIGCDPTLYEKTYEFDKMDHHKNEFKFYFIGEYITRKNVPALITAFHREFHPDEETRLVLKLNRIGMSDYDLFALIAQNIQNLKQNMAMYRDPRLYKPEIVICSHFNQSELFGFHCACDCFVLPSYGEAFCMPAFDAMAFGRTPIVGRNIGVDYINNDTGYLVDSYEIPAIATDRALPFLYNGRDTWWQISILDLQKQMRQAFNNRHKKKHIDEIKKMVLQHSHENIGQHIKQVLSCEM